MSVQRSMAKGIAWMVTLRLLDRTLGLISTIVLARLLVPEDFGLIAMATAVIAVLELMTMFGFDMAIIQARDAGRAHFDTAWTFNVLFGVFALLVLALGAEAIATFWGDPRLTDVVTLLAAVPLLRGLENIGIVAFRKELEFHKEFQLNVIRRVVGVALTVLLAWWWRDYHALIAGMLLQGVFGVALSYVLHPYRPRLSLAAGSELIGFSKWLLLHNLLGLARQRSADFLVGRFSGAEALGQFSIAAEIARLPATELVAPINRAIFPGYSKLAGDPARMRAAFMNVTGATALIVLPAAIGMSAVAPLLVPLMLGPKWLMTVPLIELLAIAGAFHAFTAQVPPVFMALGKVYVATVFSALNVVLMIALMWWWVQSDGALGAAQAVLVATLAVHQLPLHFARRELGLALSAYLSGIWRALAGTVAMYAATTAWVGHWVGHVDAAGGTAALVGALLAALVIAVLSYAGVVLGLWTAQGRPDGAERIVLGLLAGLAGRLRRRR